MIKSSQKMTDGFENEILRHHPEHDEALYIIELYNRGFDIKHQTLKRLMESTHRQNHLRLPML